MSRTLLLLVTIVLAVVLSTGALLMVRSDAHAETSAFVVNSTGDLGDVNRNDDVCDVDDATPGNQCTLRAAIEEANHHSGPDTIDFDIPGGGVKTITLSGVLPALTDKTGPTTIDGYTQPGSLPNTAQLASNAKIMVQIRGDGSYTFGGLPVASPANVVRGLALYNLRGGVLLYGSDAHDNHITGNFLGTNAAGRYHAPKRITYYANGVRLTGGASNNYIGGTSIADRNVLSGNATSGIGFYDPGTNSNVVVGNLIGLNPSGTARLSNLAHGVDINAGASYNVVGGTLQVERNVISGNAHEGVEVSHVEGTNGFSSGNQVIGNFVGTNLSGEGAPRYARNGANGVHLEDGATGNVVRNNTIGNSGESGVGIEGTNVSDNQVYSNWIGISRGGTAIPNRIAGVWIFAGAHRSQIGPNNIITNNPVGVRIGRLSYSNSIKSNRIRHNTGLGIDLEPFGVVNKNDSGDADTGANQKQNFPVLKSATTSGSTTSIKGQLNSSPNKTFTIQFFANPKATNEGASFIGEKQVTTGAGGKVSFTFRANKAVRPKLAITATATDPDGNTSEFSAPRTVTQP